ncbi:MAG: hypothetical protein WCD08_12085 [Steroidobacteraceae bacterium]
MSTQRLLRSTVQGALCAILLFAMVSPASAIPAFARKYSLRCTACHEAWPVLNDFGRSFRDNGYQLRLGKDNTVTAEPGYWPVAVRIVPNYTYTRVSNQETDSGPRTLGSGGIADSGIDLLMAGTLTENISFLVVPTGFASDGTVNLESFWAYFSRVVKNSDWLNIRIGQFEVDLPASGHRPLSMTSGYLLYSYHPMAVGGEDIAAYDMGENQRGVEFTGHDRASLTRYSVAVFSAHDSLGTRNAVSSPSYYWHLQKYFRFNEGLLSQFEVGAWGAVAKYPTNFLTLGGDPIPSSGSDLATSNRYGIEANAWLGPSVAPLHLDLVYGRGTDSRALYSTAERDATWNGGFLEASWVPARDQLHWTLFGRFDTIRNQNQPTYAAPSNLNNQDQWTLGARYTIAYSTRDEVAMHAEISSNNIKGVGFEGLDQRTDSLMIGVDFAY